MMKQIFRIILALLFIIAFYSRLKGIDNQIALTLHAWPAYFFEQLFGKNNFFVNTGECHSILSFAGVIFFYGGLLLLSFINSFITIFKKIL